VNSARFKVTPSWLAKTGAVVLACLVTAVAAQVLNKPLRDRWSPQEVATLASMRLKEAGPRPADPSNAYEQRT
jgi:cytochrome c peroxidase